MKKLLLIGGGHAHVEVIRSLIDAPIADTEVTLITPYVRQVYSGMLPGWIAGHYALEDCVIQLTPLAARARVRVVQASVTAMDLVRQHVTTDTAGEFQYDVVSLDIGSAPNVGSMDVTSVHDRIITIRPIERFVEQVQRAIEHAQGGARSQFAVIGGGVGGSEIALALKHRLGDGAEVSLLSSRMQFSPRVSRFVEEALAQARVTHHANVRAKRVSTDANTQKLVIEYSTNAPPKQSQVLHADVVIAALGSSVAAWPRVSGLAVDEKGYILVNTHLQSTSHANVFAAGDCATMVDAPRPKSGVYAVRAGPPLATNLRAALAQQSLTLFVPSVDALYLIATGPKHAIGLRGAFSLRGRWAWRWKDKIDRAFMRKYKVSND
jgi:pyridine nucleotide-disulfide oxidoreductase family protein